MEGRFEPAVVAPFPVDPVDPLDPLDPLKNSGRLVFAVIYNVFFTFCRKMRTIFRVCALLALRWPQIASGVELGGLLEQILVPRWAK